MINANLLPFFNELAQNNSKAWFNERKAQYKKMHQEFADGLLHVAFRLAEFDTQIRERLDDPTTVKVHRIYNDTRFSKQADPLKTNISGVISAGGYAPMYYLRIEPAGSILAGGMFMPPTELLAAIREELAESYDELEETLQSDSVSSAFPAGLDRSMALKTAPRGYAADHPAIEFLRLKSFTVGRSLTDQEVTDPDVQDTVVGLFEAQYELHRYLRKAIRRLPDA